MNNNQFQLFDNEISHILSQTNCHVIDADEIVKKYGIEYNNFNYIVCGDNLPFFLCVKGVWNSHHVQQNILPEKIRDFISCCDKFSYLVQKNCICLYLSKNLLISSSKDDIERENLKISNCKIYVINDNNKNVLYDKLKLFLHLIGLFLYESDGSAMMLDAF